MKPRNLKIEASGDFYRGKVRPMIRLAGQWLERAGFKPCNRVEIQISGQGIMTLRFLNQQSIENFQKSDNRTDRFSMILLAQRKNWKTY
jgi:hypothetical protein